MDQTKTERNLFDTKPRMIFVFDPETVDRRQMLEVIGKLLELPEIPGFRGCLPCAASGMDVFAFESLVLPQLRAAEAAAKQP